MCNYPLPRNYADDPMLRQHSTCTYLFYPKLLASYALIQRIYIYIYRRVPSVSLHGLPNYSCTLCCLERQLCTEWIPVCNDQQRIFTSEFLNLRRVGGRRTLENSVNIAIVHLTCIVLLYEYMNNLGGIVCAEVPLAI